MRDLSILCHIVLNTLPAGAAMAAGISASVLLGSGTALDAGFQSDAFGNIDNQDRDVFELTLRQTIIGRAWWASKGHYAEYPRSDETQTQHGRWVVFTSPGD